MEQVKRWADNVCMCTFDLPANLSASGYQGAGMQNPRFFTIMCTNRLLFCGLWNFFLSFGLLQSFFPTVLFLSPLDTTKVWSGRSYASHGALEKVSSRKSERHTTTSGTTPFHLKQLRKHLASPKNTQRFSTKTLRESPPVLTMRPYTGNLGSGVALISSVHWKAWIRCSTHI